MEFVTANWQYFLLGFYILEKVVKATPTNKDDIIFDMVIKPVFDALKTLTGKGTAPKVTRKDKIKDVG